MFSLGVIAYQMLTGSLPYGAQVAQARTRSQLGKLRYKPASDVVSDIPTWMDAALRRARAIPIRGSDYESLSEFTHDLRHPNANFLNAAAGTADRAPAEPGVLEMRDGDPRSDRHGPADCGVRALAAALSLNQLDALATRP